MKKHIAFLFLLLLCFCNGLKAQLTPADSIIYYLHQVKALEQKDSVFLGRAADILISISFDSAEVIKIEKVLSRSASECDYKNLSC